MSEVAQAVLSTKTSAQIPPTITETTGAPPAVQADPRFDLIAKQDRKLREREAMIAQKEKDSEERGKKYAGYDEEEEIWKKNPLEGLKKRGFDLEAVNKWATENLGDEDLDPVAKKFKSFDATLKSEIDRVTKELTDNFNKAIEEKEKGYKDKDLDFQVKEFKGSIKSFIAENKKTYEFVSSQEDPEGMVFDIIEQDLKNQHEAGTTDLKPMNQKDACELLENYLEGEFDKNSERMLGLDKVKSKLKLNDSKPFNYQSEPPKTLTHNLTTKSENDPSQLSREERLQLAAKQMREMRLQQQT